MLDAVNYIPPSRTPGLLFTAALCLFFTVWAVIVGVQAYRARARKAELHGGAWGVTGPWPSPQPGLTPPPQYGPPGRYVAAPPQGYPQAAPQASPPPYGQQQRPPYPPPPVPPPTH
jgi:hypothetical protein